MSDTQNPVEFDRKNTLQSLNLKNPFCILSFTECTVYMQLIHVDISVLVYIYNICLYLF